MTVLASAAKLTPHHLGNSLVTTLTVTAVAVAIIGVVEAIFSSNMFAAVGYAILGISSGVLWLWGSLNLELFKKMQSAMDNDVTLMNDANKKTADLTEQLAQEDTAFKQNAANLQAQVTAFKNQNAQLQSNLKTMDGQLQRFGQDNKDLTLAKSGLEKDLSDLQKSYANIQAQVQQFLSLNLQMGQTVGAFQNSGDGVVKTAQDLQGAVAKLTQAESDVSNLAGQIELGRKSLQQILGYMTAQQQKQKQEIDRLSGVVTDMQSAQKDLSSQNNQLNSQVKAWAARSQQMDQMSQQLKDTEAQIGKSQDSLQQAIQKLTAKREELAKENQRLQDNQQKMTESLKGIDDRIATKQAQVADLNAQILAKIDQLKSLKGQIAALQKN